MICPCEQLTKKRTLVDGIKSLYGILTVYTYNNEKYINECCFKTLIPSIFTFITKEWFLHAEMIIISNQETSKTETKLIYRITPEILKTIISYASTNEEEPLSIVEVNTGITSLSAGYNKVMESLTLAYQSVIQLEKDMNGIKYKYSSINYDNECLNKQLQIFKDRKDNKATILAENKEEKELMNHNDRIDSKKIANKCNLCKSFTTIKEDLKKLKQENHDKISKIQYEHDIAKKKIFDMQYNAEKMNEEILRLKEENKLLRATNSINTISSYDN